MAFFDEWKEKWESWSLSAKAAVIGGILLILVGVGGLFSKKRRVRGRNDSGRDDNAGRKDRSQYYARNSHFRGYKKER